ncbi:MAG: RNA methyltransferase [Balneolaceae bacterium]|nr:MAG: RNA methyltransferase [Balneolaceae bacterium]
MKPTAQQLKEWRKLRMGKYRKRNRLFIAEGVRTVEQILMNGAVRPAAVLRREGHPDPLSFESDIPLFEVSAEEFNSLCDTETPQGVLAVCEVPEPAGTDILIRTQGIILALDAVQDPGNLGTIIRTATWFGAGAILFGRGCADPFHPKVVRSTAGATGALPYLHGDLTELLPLFEESGRNVILLDAGENSLNLKEAVPVQNPVLVIGNEANGIDPKLFSGERTAVHIPGAGSMAESLNASVASAIALFYFTDFL